VHSAAFSPNGAWIATASYDTTSRIWDVAAAKAIAVLHGEDHVNSATFSPDGSRIVTASWDQTARIWDTVTGREIAVLRGHQAEVNYAGFSPDGRRVVTASADYTARIWDARFLTMSPSNLLTEICARRLAGLTTLTRDEMRLAGYPDNRPAIDVCAASE